MTRAYRLLVTGAKGLLGSHIVKRAHAEQCEVIAGYRGASGNDAVHLDVCDSSSLDGAFRSSRPSIVIHCAAYGVNYADQDPDSALAVNVQGTLNVLATAARYGVERFVHIGSCFEYGSKPGPIAEDASLTPTALYGATKAAATLLAIERARALDVPLVVARPFGVWGPGEGPHRLVPQIIAACMSRTPLSLTPCEVLRDYSYVEDLAANILALAQIPEIPAGTIVNVGTGKGIQLRDFVLSVARVLNGADLLRFGALPQRPTEMPSLVADATRMHELLGARPITPMDEGVQRMLDRLGGLQTRGFNRQANTI